MTCEEFKATLDLLASGWSTRNYAEAAGHFAETVFYSDPLNYTFTSNTALEQFFRNDEGREQFCKFHKVIFDEDGQFGAAEYTYEGTYRYHGTVWVELSGGKILSWSEYQHKSVQTWGEFWKTNA